jgi:hypothetical protein
VPVTSRQTPGYGNLPHLRDPVTRQVLQQIFDRLGKIDQQLQDLIVESLKTDTVQPVDAQGQRVINAKDPLNPQDLVTLRYFNLILNNQVQLLRNQIAAAEGEGGAGTCFGQSPPTVELPNYAAEVESYAAANQAALDNSCIKAGGSWEFMDGLVLHLRGLDERFGWNGKRGNVDDPSHDAVAYYFGILPPIDGSPDCYVVDVISCLCGPEDGEPCVPGPFWKDQTCVGGAGAAWLFANPLSP